MQATESHVCILEICVDLILGLGWSKSPGGERPDSLQQYALDIWIEHIGKVNIDDDTAVLLQVTTVLLQVTTVLHRISVNVEMFARALQRHGPDVDAVLPQRRPDSVARYDRCVTWVKPASSLSSDDFPHNIQQWIEQPANGHILLPIVRGLTRAWLSTYPPRHRAGMYRLTSNCGLVRLIVLSL